MEIEEETSVARYSCDGHNSKRASPVDEGQYRARRCSRLIMPKDPKIAIRDCLAEIEVLHEIEGRMTLRAFRNDPTVRRAAAHAIQTISEEVRHISDDRLADLPTTSHGRRSRLAVYRVVPPSPTSTNGAQNAGCAS
jgi:hypothetical protein